jgi:hypothetical protein
VQLWNILTGLPILEEYGRNDLKSALIWWKEEEDGLEAEVEVLYQERELLAQCFTFSARI